MPMPLGMDNHVTNVVPIELDACPGHKKEKYFGVKTRIKKIYKLRS